VVWVVAPKTAWVNTVFDFHFNLFVGLTVSLAPFPHRKYHVVVCDVFKIAIYVSVVLFAVNPGQRVQESLLLWNPKVEDRPVWDKVRSSESNENV